MLRAQHLIIIDVEATCWSNKPPLGETSEIIEVGVCLYDLQTGAIGDADGMLVKPARSNVSPFCTRLTTITADMLIDAPPFAEVCDQLRNRYHSAARAWASWGAYDRKMFEAQCASFGVPYPFSEQHINLKQWYADLELDGKRVGMAAALRREQLMLDGTHHRGGDDAHNIARIVASVLARRGRGCLAV